MLNHQEHKGPQEHQKTALPPALDQTARLFVDSCYTVHKAIGPGLLESAYEACLLEELSGRGLCVQTQVPLPVTFKGKKIDVAYRLDMLIENDIIVELKSVDRLLPIHTAQILSYLKLSFYRLGFLVNFNSPLIKDGIRRFIF